jgi:hypothetical protein
MRKLLLLISAIFLCSCISIFSQKPHIKIYYDSIDLEDSKVLIGLKWNYSSPLPQEKYDEKWIASRQNKEIYNIYCNNLYIGNAYPYMLMEIKRRHMYVKCLNGIEYNKEEDK